MRRDWVLIAAGACLLGVSVAVVVESVGRIGRPFAGFLVLENRVVASTWGLSLAIFIATQIRWVLRAPTCEVRQRVKVVVFGAVAALSPVVIIALGSWFTGVKASQNAMAFAMVFYPFAVGYAVLLLGRPLSGQIYGGDDRRRLHTLADQGAVAIENASELERLRELNRDLELKVSERTRELRETQAQLVHREKMASLGQFVAGIAHELNNPLNFIHGNLYCLREYVATMTEAVSVPRSN